MSQRSRHTSRWYLHIFGAFCVWQTSLKVTKVGRSHRRFCRRQGLNFLLWGTLTPRAGRVNRDPHRPISQGHRPNRDNRSSVAQTRTFTSISISNIWTQSDKGSHLPNYLRVGGTWGRPTRARGEHGNPEKRTGPKIWNLPQAL